MQPPQHRVQTSLITLFRPQIHSLTPCMAQPMAKVKGRAPAVSGQSPGLMQVWWECSVPDWDGAVGGGPPVLECQGQPWGVAMCPHFPVIALSLALALADQTICISQAGWKPHDLGTYIPALARCSIYSSLGKLTGAGVATALRAPTTPSTAAC